MDYNFSFESEDILDDDTIVNDETAVDEAGDDSETVNVTPDTKETSHNEVASAGGVSTGNNQDQLEMDPVAATESYILRQFGLSREDMEEAVEETIDEAETIPNADVLEGEEDPDIIATAVTDNAIIESAAQDEVDSAGEVVDADDTPDLGVEDADSCMDGEDSAEAYLDWDIYGRSQENMLIHTPSVNDIVRQKDYGKLKQKIDDWMEDTGCSPCTKEEFEKWYTSLSGDNHNVHNLFFRAFSFNVVDGQSYIMVQSMVSFRAAIATIIGTLTLAGPLMFLISLLKHAMRGEYVGYMYAVGKDKKGSCKIMNDALFCVTKDKRSFRKDAVGSVV
jgi:hypothetical protein